MHHGMLAQTPDFAGMAPLMKGDGRPIKDAKYTQLPGALQAVFLLEIFNIGVPDTKLE